MAMCMRNLYVQDVVDPVTDEMLARFVVDSHARSQPKGVNLEDQPVSNSQDDLLASARPADPEVPYLIALYLGKQKTFEFEQS